MNTGTMIDPQQATNLRLFLLNQLEQNGFGDVAREVSVRLRDESERIDNPVQQLFYFLDNSIEILKSFSTDNIDALKSRFKGFIQIEGGLMQKVYFRGKNGKQLEYNLKDLPIYEPVIKELTGIRDLLKQEEKG